MFCVTLNGLEIQFQMIFGEIRIIFNENDFSPMWKG